MKKLTSLFLYLPLLLSAADQQTQPPAQQSSLPRDRFSRNLEEYAKAHQSFRDCCLEDHEEEFFRLAKMGQTPRTLFITCSDSRIVPDLINQLRGGEMFVVRNAGNFVPTYDKNIAYDGIAASIVYGVDVLGVKDIIVCGHTHCGAIEGLYKDPASLPPVVANWIKFGEEAKKFVTLNGNGVTDQEKYTMTGKVSVLFQLAHLASYPTIKEKITQGKVLLHAWYYDIATGSIYYFEPDVFSFVPLIDVLNKTQ